MMGQKYPGSVKVTQDIWVKISRQCESKSGHMGQDIVQYECESGQIVKTSRQC